MVPLIRWKHGSTRDSRLDRQEDRDQTDWNSSGHRSERAEASDQGESGQSPEKVSVHRASRSGPASKRGNSPTQTHMEILRWTV